ncbi:hypothetical protein GWK47_045440 [Chionoecetes opilio]|uniref:Uncharacterized protein n=1 Tax=Chionoecetes opilio TaxID=41210 RepID=A0A8J4Y5L6_CHIOP|nr:hypothetical protein GWK47_045440 [Chionoecetes opilio]
MPEKDLVPPQRLRIRVSNRWASTLPVWRFSTRKSTELFLFDHHWRNSPAANSPLEKKCCVGCIHSDVTQRATGRLLSLNRGSVGETQNPNNGDPFHKSQVGIRMKKYEKLKIIGDLVRTLNKKRKPHFKNELSRPLSTIA